MAGPVPNTDTPAVPNNNVQNAFAPIGADSSIDINEGLDMLLGQLAVDPKKMDVDRIAQANELAVRSLQREQAPADQPAEKDFPEGQEPQPAPVKEPSQQPGPAPDDTYIEWADEAGKTTRIPLNDAIVALQGQVAMTRQMEQLRQQAAQMPQEVANAILGVAQVRQQLLAEVDQIKNVYRPAPPPRQLLDKTSPQYDPEKYAAMLADFDRGRQWLGQVEQARARQQQSLTAEQTALHQATVARGRAQLSQGLQTGDGLEGWPELFSDPTEQTSLGDLLRWAGYDPQTALETVLDPRAYLIMKVAREGLAARRAKRAPVRPVRSAPRLVRGAGRVQPSQDETSADMTRLAQTGAYSDAEAIIMRIMQGK